MGALQWALERSTEFTAIVYPRLKSQPPISGDKSLPLSIVWRRQVLPMYSWPPDVSPETPGLSVV